MLPLPGLGGVRGRVFYGWWVVADRTGSYEVAFRIDLLRARTAAITAAAETLTTPDIRA